MKFSCKSGCDKMQSFLKWPGGKRWIISKYNKIFPKNFNNYIEPFLGGGSIFFYLSPKKALISDINKELINTYLIMANHPHELKKLLKEHQKNHNSDYYYTIRNNNPTDNIEKAGRFLYLNRTCFNGMYRVNKKGYFNVPIGTKNHFIADIDSFEKYSNILKKAQIVSKDFEEIIFKAKKGDLVFADPPYTIAHNQNAFIKYNENLFSWKDQTRLLDSLIHARNNGAIIISTNAYFEELKTMYSDNGFYTTSISRYSSISGKNGGRGQKKELLISSYSINKGGVI